jgi:hypothetical protein
LGKECGKKSKKKRPAGLTVIALLFFKALRLKKNYRFEAFSDRYLATPSGEAPIPCLPFSH